MALIDGMLQELEQEAQTTRRVLERVPDDQLAWRRTKKRGRLESLRCMSRSSRLGCRARRHSLYGSGPPVY